MKLAIITANTQIYQNMEENKPGSTIQSIAEEAGLKVTFNKAFPLDKEVLSGVMKNLADTGNVDLIFTAGGCGCSADNWTPEATAAIIDREVPGIPEALRAYMLTITRHSMINRCKAGFRGKVLIVNLPGKSLAIEKSLNYILPEVIHAVKLAQGEA